MFNLCIIGVYLNYNANNVESNIKYQNQLNILEECINKNNQSNKAFVIIGDFNGDIYRLKYANDINLNNFINKMTLKAATSDQVKSDYTYYSQIISKEENKS
jgi:hypothetical protein